TGRQGTHDNFSDISPGDMCRTSPQGNDGWIDLPAERASDPGSEYRGTLWYFGTRQMTYAEVVWWGLVQYYRPEVVHTGTEYQYSGIERGPRTDPGASWIASLRAERWSAAAAGLRGHSLATDR